MGPDVGIG